MIGVSVKYKKNSWSYEEHGQEATYTATLVTVNRVEGQYMAVIYVDGALRVIPATDLDEWEV
jgi:hypothetical protein